MMYSQYLRIETKAGGANCTSKDFIRAAYTVLASEGKTRQVRDLRHAWLREGLSLLTTCKNL